MFGEQKRKMVKTLLQNKFVMFFLYLVWLFLLRLSILLLLRGAS